MIKNFLYKWGLVLITLIALIISCSYNYYHYKQLKVQEKLFNQNIKASNDSLKLSRNSLNQMVSSRASYALENDKLKQYNKSLSEQVEANKNKVISINEILMETNKQYKELLEQSKVTIIYETKDSTIKSYVIDWNIDRSNQGTIINLEGQTILNIKIDSILNAFTSLKNLKFSTQLYTGIQYNKKEKVYEAFVNCKDSSFTFDINSNIDPEIFYKEPKKWTIGFIGGFGISSDFKFNTSFPSMFIGIGLSYKLFEW